MGFIRHIDETPKVLEHFKGGKGNTEIFHIVQNDEELNGKGRLYSVVRLQKDCEIGTHRHQGDTEMFFVLKGRGKTTVNGECVEIGPGDVVFTDEGEEHFLLNECEEPLELMALVLYK